MISLPGGDVELSEDVLDRIDEIMPPSTEVHPTDNYAPHHRRSRKRRAAADLLPRDLRPPESP